MTLAPPLVGALQASATDPLPAVAVLRTGGFVVVYELHALIALHAPAVPLAFTALARYWYRTPPTESSYVKVAEFVEPVRTTPVPSRVTSNSHVEAPTPPDQVAVYPVPVTTIEPSVEVPGPVVALTAVQLSLSPLLLSAVTT